LLDSSAASVARISYTSLINGPRPLTLAGAWCMLG
jgi:hypothetical protein